MVRTAAGKVGVVSVIAAMALAAVVPAQAGAFAEWTSALRLDAAAAGVSGDTFDAAMGRVSLLPKVIELDRRQPEYVDSFWRYLDSRVAPRRIEEGRERLEEHRALLEAISARYGVPATVLVSLWGLESNFGTHTGRFRAVDALTTLAFEGRRGAFFRGELIALMQLMERRDLGSEAEASWAGALGQPQFMPTTYRDFSVDFDGDAQRDLWSSLPDVFASAARYLQALGWESSLPWGVEVRLPDGFEYGLTDLDTELPVEAWRDLGVRDIFGGALPGEAEPASILIPAGATGGPALMVFRNFRVIMNWNRSIYYAISVGHLADRIGGRLPFQTPFRDDRLPLTRAEMIEIQTLLTRLGFDTGGIDGFAGTRTRQAVRGFQANQGLPADGLADSDVLTRLRAATRS